MSIIRQDIVYEYKKVILTLLHSTGVTGNQIIRRFDEKGLQKNWRTGADLA